MPRHPRKNHSPGIAPPARVPSADAISHEEQIWLEGRPEHRRQIPPAYSKNRVDRAGAAVRKGTNTPEHDRIVENWRAAHSHVLNTFQAALRKHARAMSGRCVVSQRLKRNNTIRDKLGRPGGKGVKKLSSMQDIAGCRIICNDMDALHVYRDRMFASGRKAKHEHKVSRNYIKHPKPDGYRGIHDIYRYVSFSDTERARRWNGLQVEIQYRTRVQHAWATAVEVAGALTGQHTKLGRGDERQRRFFALSSEILARVHEDGHSYCSTVPDKQLAADWRRLDGEINLFRKLQILAPARENVTPGCENFILMLEEVVGGLQLHILEYEDSGQALSQYPALEKMYPDMDIVLVRTAGDTLHSAYRNYFYDAREFVQLMKEGLRALRQPQRRGRSRAASDGP